MTCHFKRPCSVETFKTLGHKKLNSLCHQVVNLWGVKPSPPWSSRSNTHMYIYSIIEIFGLTVWKNLSLTPFGLIKLVVLLKIFGFVSKRKHLLRMSKDLGVERRVVLLVESSILRLHPSRENMRQLRCTFAGHQLRGGKGEYLTAHNSGYIIRSKVTELI